MSPNQVPKTTHRINRNIHSHTTTSPQRSSDEHDGITAAKACVQEPQKLLFATDENTRDQGFVLEVHWRLLSPREGKTS